MVTQKNNRPKRDLCRIKENNYKSTDTGYIPNTINNNNINLMNPEYLCQEEDKLKCNLHANPQREKILNFLLQYKMNFF